MSTVFYTFFILCKFCPPLHIKISHKCIKIYSLVISNEIDEGIVDYLFVHLIQSCECVAMGYFKFFQLLYLLFRSQSTNRIIEPGIEWESKTVIDTGILLWKFQRYATCVANRNIEWRCSINRPVVAEWRSLNFAELRVACVTQFRSRGTIVSSWPYSRCMRDRTSEFSPLGYFRICVAVRSVILRQRNLISKRPRGTREHAWDRVSALHRMCKLACK